MSEKYSRLSIIGVKIFNFQRCKIDASKYSGKTDRWTLSKEPESNRLRRKEEKKEEQKKTV